MLGTKVLDVEKSKFSGELRVIKSLGFGTYIQAGGLTQSGGIVETIWKSTLKKVKKEKKEVENILLLGFGGGTVAKLAKKLWPEVKITGVDIDQKMVDLGLRYLKLPQEGIKIKIQDALKFKTREKFDLIVVDLYCGDVFPVKLEKLDYFLKLKQFLKSDGILVVNRLYFGDKRPETAKFGKMLEGIFKVKWYYPQANLMFLCKN